MGNLNPNNEHKGGDNLHPSGAMTGRSGERVIPFGKYLLLDRIAVGGMAEVFTAKSFGVEGFEKIIAIKRILPTMAEEEEFISMFIDEAKIAGQLTHANIVPIYELGKIGQSHYIAMEYVWGKDLLQIMNRFRRMRRHMPPVMAAWIASKICEALDFAHRKHDRNGRPLDIVHRDVSPQNCLVSYEGQVKMIDFGIAKAAMRTTKTQAGVLKGKFGYMSPEQVAGHNIDHRSDVFAVGTCMHEMLTSERLFVGESDFSTLEKVRNAEVIPPSSIAPNIPPELEAIVLRALACDPSNRFQNAGEMHEALQMFITREKPPYGTSKLASWMRTAFAAEMTKEKTRLDGLAKIAKPPLLEVASNDAIEDMPGESTTISASPFEMDGEGARGPSPFAAIDSKAAEEEMRGDATQIFFSADDNVDEEEPTTAMVGSGRSANQETASLRAVAGIEVATQARSIPPPPPPPSIPAPVRSPGGETPEDTGGAFAPPPPMALASQNEAAQKTVVKTDPVLRSRVAAQDTMQILPTARRRRSRRWLGAMLAMAGLAAMTVIVGLVIFLSRSSGGTIEIRIAPADVETIVLIDGTPRGRAPLRVENVPAGAHLIEVQAPGFQSVTQTVPVSDGAMAMLVIPLVPAIAGVPVPRAVPPHHVAAPAPSMPSATAEPNPPPPEPEPPTPEPAIPPSPTAHTGSSERQEDTTASSEPTVRQTKVRRAVVRRTSQAARTETARPPVARSETASASRERGYLMIQTLPWARVFIDGRDTGQNTPVRQMAVPAGSHRIGLRTSDGEMHVITVDVPPGETVRVVRQL